LRQTRSKTTHAQDVGDVTSYAGQQLEQLLRIHKLGGERTDGVREDAVQMSLISELPDLGRCWRPIQPRFKKCQRWGEQVLMAQVPLPSLEPKRLSMKMDFPRNRRHCQASK
jgi:hypothetical protein